MKKHGAVSPAIGFAVAATALGAQPIWILSAYAPAVQEDLEFGEVSFGIIVGTFFALSALIGLGVGRLVNSWYWRRSVGLVALVTGLSLVGIAFLANGFLGLLLLTSVGSIANSASQPVSNLAIASSVPQRRQGIAFGIKQAGLPLSTFLVGLSVPIFGNGEQWRIAFYAAAAVAAIIAVMAYRPLIGMRADRPTTPETPSKFSTGALRSGLLRGIGISVPRALVYTAIASGIGTAVTTSIGGFLVLFGTSQGLAPASAAQLLAFGSIVGIASRLLVGNVADHLSSGHMLVIAGMMSVGVVGLVLLAHASGSLMALGVGVFLAFGFGWAWNGLLHYSVVRYSGIPAALSTSVVWTAMSVGAGVGPILFGIVASNSYRDAWYLAALCLVGAALFMVAAHREVPGVSIQV